MQCLTLNNEVVKCLFACLLTACIYAMLKNVLHVIVCMPSCKALEDMLELFVCMP